MEGDGRVIRKRVKCHQINARARRKDYVSMYVCIFLCMYACIHACIYVCMHVCMHACTHTKIHICVNKCMYMHIHPESMAMDKNKRQEAAYIDICEYIAYVCMHACTDVCFHIHVYAYPPGISGNGQEEATSGSAKRIPCCDLEYACALS